MQEGLPEMDAWFDIATLQHYFREFSVTDRLAASSEVGELAAAIAEDPEVLSLATRVRWGQPVGHLLLACARYLRLTEASHARSPVPTAKVHYPAYRAFLLEHADAIRQLMVERRAQVNEVGRSAPLVLAFEAAHRRLGQKPLVLIEFGTCAGFNLFWDQYAYDFSGGRICGDMRSGVQLSCRLLGSYVPPLPACAPTIASRIGIDLQPIDVAQPEHALWLQALLPSDDAEGLSRLQAVMDVVRSGPPRIFRGDALDLLPDTLAAVPGDCIPCVYHSHTTYPFPAARYQQFLDTIAAAGVQRDLCHIAYEPVNVQYLGGRRLDELRITLFERGRMWNAVVAIGDQFGEWLAWKPDSDQPDHEARDAAFVEWSKRNLGGALGLGIP